MWLPLDIVDVVVVAVQPLCVIARWFANMVVAAVVPRKHAAPQVQDVPMVLVPVNFDGVEKDPEY